MISASRCLLLKCMHSISRSKIKLKQDTGMQSEAARAFVDECSVFFGLGEHGLDLKVLHSIS